MSDSQLTLFSDNEQRALFLPECLELPNLEIDSNALQNWKQAIATYQQDVRFSQVSQQGSLFDLAQVEPINGRAKIVEPSAIDPFYLHLYNFFFFEQPASKHPGQPAIYFVIDVCVPLILYIGETVQANQRWKGIHDCKRYVLNYRNLHFKHGVETAINTAFYWDTPTAVRSRQRLESALIQRWRSPFNKENWSFWGTPFVGGKPGVKS